jgi:hypothetical protein
MQPLADMLCLKHKISDRLTSMDVAGCDEPVSVASEYPASISRSAGSTIMRFDCSIAGKSGEVRLRFPSEDSFMRTFILLLLLTAMTSACAGYPNYGYYPPYGHSVHRDYPAYAGGAWRHDGHHTNGGHGGRGRYFAPSIPHHHNHGPFYAWNRSHERAHDGHRGHFRRHQNHSHHEHG